MRGISQDVIWVQSQIHGISSERRYPVRGRHTQSVRDADNPFRRFCHVTAIPEVAPRDPVSVGNSAYRARYRTPGSRAPYWHRGSGHVSLLRCRLQVLKSLVLLLGGTHENLIDRDSAMAGGDVADCVGDVVGVEDVGCAEAGVKVFEDFVAVV